MWAWTRCQLALPSDDDPLPPLDERSEQARPSYPLDDDSGRQGTSASMCSHP